MDTWLGRGIEPEDTERRTVLSLLTICVVTTSDTDGTLRTRTAVVEQVGQSGRTLSVRLLGSGLKDDVVLNPRIIISALPTLGPYELVSVNGLARIQPHLATAHQSELLVLEVAVQRMECWRGTRTAPSVSPAAAAAIPDIGPAERSQEARISA